MLDNERNINIYNDPCVVKHYTEDNHLQSCEEYIFKKYIKNGSSILDLGVGGGRTTIYLSCLSDKYIGVDYSESMINACIAKFPDVNFYCLDAQDLSKFSDDSFDNIIFAFNGIDYLLTPSARALCLMEVKRVLRPGGHFIFSSHHAKSIFIRPRLLDVSLKKKAWRIVRALMLSSSLTLKSLSNIAFWRGEGYVMDPVHGGLMTYVSTPDIIRNQTSAAGMQMLEIVGALYPEQTNRFFVPWYYYVLSH